MAEALKTFREGEDILASETNENNQFLLSKLSDNAAQVQSYVEGEVATIKSNVASVQATLQENINTLQKTITDEANSRVFVNKELGGYIGEMNLSSYLPNDKYHYLVWVNAWYGRNGANETLYAMSDVLTTARRLYWCDGDSGRSSRGVFFGAIPVGPNRKLIFSGTAATLVLCGYSRL